MRRVPSRTSASGLPPHVTGQFYFAVPARGRVTGVVLQLHRRPAKAEPNTITVPDLPVPGS
jgi:hypothetical protein